MYKTTKVFFVLFMTMFAGFFMTACGGEESFAPSENGYQENTGQVEFPEKEITVVVPYSAGGGFDVAVRILAPYWEENLPEGASIVVENMPGGEGNIGLGEVARAEPDGHTVGILNIPGHYVNQVVGDASYDLTEFEYIGTVTTTTYVAAGSPSSGFSSLGDMQNADEVIAAITNISSTDGLGTVVAGEETGINLRTINHEGSSEAVLSAMRGDADMVQFPVESLIAEIEAGELEPLWVYSDERIDELPDTPTIAELGYEGLLDLVSLHRVLATTPDTPEEVLRILREAFDEAVNNPEYIEEVEESGAFWNPTGYQETETVVQSSYDMIFNYKKLLQESR